MKTLTIKQSESKGVTILQLNGVLNADTSAKLDELLRQLQGTPPANVLIDMEELTFISSAGIGCFIGAIRDIRNAQGDIRFCNIHARILRVFELLDMLDFFEFHDSTKQGLESFQ